MKWPKMSISESLSRYTHEIFMKNFIKGGIHLVRGFIDDIEDVINNKYNSESDEDTSANGEVNFSGNTNVTKHIK